MSVRKRFHGAVTSLIAERGRDIRRVFIHHPISDSSPGWTGAIAADCANAQDRFEQFIDAVYETQDSIGTIPWIAYAERAGVHDLKRFAACLADSGSSTRRERGLQLGTSAGVRGTPTVIINGWRLSSAPHQNLAETVDRILAQEKPFRR
jgi:protein-disulfide isomerase